MTFPLMIFAAGLGTRMGSLTKNRPKPMINVAGQPLIGHALDLVDEAGIRKVVVNTHYKPDALEDYLRQKDVEIVRETDQLLDTGGGLKNAIPKLGDGPVFGLNSDVIWRGPNPLSALRHAWRAEMGALMMLVPMDRCVGRTGAGDVALGADGRVCWRGDFVYSGAQIIQTDLVRDIPKDVFSLRLVWEQLVAENRLFGIIYTGQWADVGHPSGISAAEEMVANV